MKKIFLTVLSLTFFAVVQAARGESWPNQIDIVTDNLGHAVCELSGAGKSRHQQFAAWDARWISAAFEGLPWKMKDPAK